MLSTNADSLANVYRGWEGYQFSLVQALTPMTVEQLKFRPAPGLRSVGGIFRHIALGRLGWFLRMNAPGSAELAERIGDDYWESDADGNRYIREDAFPIAEQPGELLRWLGDSWGMVEQMLAAWTVAD